MKCINILFYLFTLIECYRILSPTEMRVILKTTPPSLLEPGNSGKFLDAFNQVRVAGTKGSEKVRLHIVNHFKRLKWAVRLDHFQADTPIGITNFTNIIATKDFGNNRRSHRKKSDLSNSRKDFKSPKRLVLAAHYDSKLHPEGFIGAIDSAVPCAVLMYIAEALNALLYSTSYSGIQFMFLDGEESFHDWTATDSIYGAKHLAERLSNAEIQEISAFILLDLLGSAGSHIPCLYEKTEKLFFSLRNVQQRMISAGLLHTKTPFLTERRLFKVAPFIEDDHVPFLKRGVPIMHIIPPTFPSVWHTLDDDFEHLHVPTVKDWAATFAIFIAEALELSVMKDEL